MFNFKKQNIKEMKQFAKTFLTLSLLGVIILTILVVVNKKENKAHSKMKELVLIQYNDSPLSELSQEGILKGLSLIGLTRDVDFKIKISNAQGDISTLNLMVDAAVNDRPDLIFVTSTPTLQVTTKKIKDIPVVFTVVADPIVAGVGTSFTEHLPNITGISTLGDYKGMVSWLLKIIPNVKTIGTLYSPGEPNSVKNMNDLKKYAELAGLKLITIPVNSSAEISDAALALADNRPDVICQIIDNQTSAAFSGISKVAKNQKIPLFGFVSDQAEKGAILVVSRNYEQAGIDAVMLAKKIFDGTSPLDIPFEFVSKTDVFINTEAATFYGITLPDELLNSTDVIRVK
jgi:ABC-type uncharacterized transport system substrate-binding protein